MFTTCVCARCVCLEFLMDLYRSMLHAALTSWIVREQAVRPRELYGFRGRKAICHASALVVSAACP